MVKYAFGAKLPLEVDVVMMIIRDAPSSQPGRETKLRTQVINDFTTSIMQLWCKAFGMENVQSRKVVQTKIRKLINTYYNEYYVLSTGSKKRKNELLGKSKRQLFTIWAENHMGLFDLLKTTVNPQDFDEDERQFYNNQKSNRVGTISSEIDERYSNPLLRPDSEIFEEPEEEQDEVGDDARDETVEMEIDDLNTSAGTLNISLNISGLARIVLDEKPANSSTTTFPRPEIRNQRTLTERIKLTCARVAVGAQCSE